jgi:hypothetical protein
MLLVALAGVVSTSTPGQRSFLEDQEKEDQ